MNNKKSSHKKLIWIIAISLVLLVGIVAAFIIVSKIDAENNTPTEETSTTETTEKPVETKPKLISLQSTVETWANNLTQGHAGVLIYDLDNAETVADLNSTEEFSTESLYKLFVAYEGYHLVETGAIAASDYLTANYTWGACLDLAIRESNSPCGEAMRSKIGIDNMNNIIKTSYGIEHTNIGTLVTTPADMAKMMEIYYNHKGLSAATWAKIQDSMLNQPPVDNGLCDGPCNWRQGLPTGFATATVYNKVGWRHSGRGDTWAAYHDAAIVEFPNLKRHYIMIVMTKNSPLKDIVNLGQKLEEYILSNN